MKPRAPTEKRSFRRFELKRKLNIIFLIVLLSMLLVPLLLTDTEAGAVSDADGRSLLEKPVFGNDGYTSGMEAWLRDRLGLRDSVVNTYAVSNNAVFHELINPVYQYGKNGHVFFKTHSNIENSDYHKQFAEMVSNMQEYCESRGTHFYYVFNPEKESLYREYLPPGVNYNDEWADSMLADIERKGVNCLDLRKSFADMTGKEDIFSHLNDAGHWSQTGAFYGMKALTEHIHRDISGVRPLDKAEYDISTQTIEKLYGSNQEFKEDITVYTLKAGYEDITGDLASEMVRNQNYTYFQLIQNDSDAASGIDRLLIFQDDMYGPFACARSKETATVSCLQNAINFDYYYNIFKPDVVVFETMEYVISDTYFSQASMESAVRNPAILKNYPESSFTERKDELLADTGSLNFDGSIIVKPGYSIDKVSIAGLPDKTEYAYIVTDDKVIDLKADAEGNYIADIRRGDIPEDKDTVLYILDGKGRGSYTKTAVLYDGLVPKHTEAED